MGKIKNPARGGVQIADKPLITSGPAPEQTSLEMVTLDGLVPKDHLLCKIGAVIYFSFIHDRVVGLCGSDNDHPALDPTGHHARGNTT